MFYKYTFHQVTISITMNCAEGLDRTLKKFSTSVLKKPPTSGNIPIATLIYQPTSTVNIFGSENVLTVGILRLRYFSIYFSCEPCQRYPGVHRCMESSDTVYLTVNQCAQSFQRPWTITFMS